jgi:hypothetical protein
VLYDWKLRQIDFQTAYLNSEMDHEMYMKLPPGIQWLEDMGSLPGNPVMHLLKGLYGAKQAGRLWNKMLDAPLKRRGFKVTTHDPCMYIKFMPGGRRLMVLGYVDDCAITGDPDVEIEELITSIKEEYNNKIDDGAAMILKRFTKVFYWKRWILGIWIAGILLAGLTAPQHEMPGNNSDGCTSPRTDF